VQLKEVKSQSMMPLLNLNFNNSASSNSSLDFVSSELTGGYMLWESYIGPTKAGLAIVYEALYRGSIARAPSPCGSNCTFTQSFQAPSYVCEDVDNQDPNAPWCYDIGARPNGSCYADHPMSKEMFYAANSTTDSSIVSDYNLWVRHRYVAPMYRRNKTDTTAETGYVADLDVPYENITFRCEMKKTKFEVRRTYVNSLQEIHGLWT
jgi:hypothetical protein